MSQSRSARSETDPVLLALEQAPLVPLTEAEVKALEGVDPKGPWREHEAVVGALKQSAAG